MGVLCDAANSGEGGRKAGFFSLQMCKTLFMLGGVRGADFPLQYFHYIILT